MRKTLYSKCILKNGTKYRGRVCLSTGAAGTIRLKRQAATVLLCDMYDAYCGVVHVGFVVVQVEVFSRVVEETLEAGDDEAWRDLNQLTW